MSVSEYTSVKKGFLNHLLGPQGPPSFNAAPTLTPGFNQPPFGQPTASSLPPVGINANVPVPGVQPSGGFGPSSSSAGYPAATAPSKGFVYYFINCK